MQSRPELRGYHNYVQPVVAHQNQEQTNWSLANEQEGDFTEQPLSQQVTDLLNYHQSSTMETDEPLQRIVELTSETKVLECKAQLLEKPIEHNAAVIDTLLQLWKNQQTSSSFDHIYCQQQHNQTSLNQPTHITVRYQRQLS